MIRAPPLRRPGSIASSRPPSLNWGLVDQFLDAPKAPKLLLARSFSRSFALGGGIVIWVGRRHGGADALTPLVELIAQSRSSLGHRGGEVMVFAQVLL